MHSTHRFGTTLLCTLALAGPLGTAACGSTADTGLTGRTTTAGAGGAGGSAHAGGSGGAGGGGAACAAGDFRCTGDDLETCNASRTAFQKVVTCPVKGLCDAKGGQCDVCQPGLGECASATELTVCSADGQKLEHPACVAPTPFCAGAAGAAKCVECAKAEDCIALANECALAACGADGACGA